MLSMILRLKVIMMRLQILFDDNAANNLVRVVQG